MSHNVEQFSLSSCLLGSNSVGDATPSLLSITGLARVAADFCVFMPAISNTEHYDCSECVENRASENSVENRGSENSVG